MAERTYDTRTRGEILAGARFQSFADNAGLEHVGLRELRTLDRFLGFATQRGIGTPSVDDFLSFVEAGTSTRPPWLPSSSCSTATPASTPSSRSRTR